MKCPVCGSSLESVITRLPFNVAENVVVILTQLPALRCTNCGEYVLEDAVMARVVELLGTVDRVAELEVIPFAS